MRPRNRSPLNANRLARTGRSFAEIVVRDVGGSSFSGGRGQLNSDRTAKSVLSNIRKHCSRSSWQENFRGPVSKSPLAFSSAFSTTSYIESPTHLERLPGNPYGAEARSSAFPSIPADADEVELNGRQLA